MLPDSNLTISQVSSYIGAGTNDLGTLCTHSGINMWSKWKPVRHSKKGGLTLADLQSVNWGLSIPSFANLDLLREAYHLPPGGGADWTYLKPTGGTSSPYRLGDFRNYDETAQPAIAAPFITGLAFRDGTTDGKKIVGTLIVNNGSDTEIGYDDLNLTHQYLGLALFTMPGYVLQRSVINPTPMATSVELNVNPDFGVGVPAGEYLGILFLSSSTISTTNIRGIDKFPLKVFGITVADTPVMLSHQIEWIGTGQYRTIRLRMTFINLLGDPIILLNSLIRVRYPNKDFYDTLIEGEIQSTVGNVTINPTTASGIQIDYTIDNVDSEQSWNVWWSNGGAYAYTFAGAIITPMS